MKTPNSKIFRFFKSLRFIFTQVFALILLGFISVLQMTGYIDLPVILYVFALVLLSLLFLASFVAFNIESGLFADVSSPELRDSLTKLPNHQLFLEYLEQALTLAKRHRKVMAVVKLDINKLSDVNRRYGHNQCDGLIKELAVRLHGLIRECDTLARLGGGEFGLIMNLIEHEDEVDSAVQRIIKGLEKPFLIDNENIILKISYGVCVYPSNDGSIDQLSQYASLALDNVKNIGGPGDHGVRYFNQTMNIDNSKRLNEEYNLRMALERGEFCLFFQPKVDATTGDINGMEALIRWDHPKRGIVSPLEFIPLLEQSGMILQAGDWVLKEACRLNKQWQEQGLEPIRVSVNVSSVQFKNENFIESIKLALQESGLDAQYLEIELTESCLMENVVDNIEVLNKIKKMGVTISVDDFGTGYSSLSYLNRFPIDILKIDRSFIQNVQDKTKNDNAAIVTAIMALSHSLKLDVVAEGVETAQELSYLHALGCRTIQGFLFSKPLSAVEFTKIQQDSKHMKDILVQVRKDLLN